MFVKLTTTYRNVKEQTTEIYHISEVERWISELKKAKFRIFTVKQGKKRKICSYVNGIFEELFEYEEVDIELVEVV